MRRLAAIMAMGTPQITSPFLTNLVSYWKLDEVSGTRSDSFGTNHLTDNNTVTSATGKQGNAAQFTAANSEYLSCASNSTLQMSGNTSFTITAWVQLSSVTGASSISYSLITKDDDAASSRDYTMDYLDAAGQGVRFYTQGGAVCFINSSVTATNGVWYFVVAWYDSSNGQAHIRINDTSQVDSSTGATGTDVSAAQFRIGAREYAGFPDYANAIIDEVGLWKRVLTGAEITQLYNGGLGLTYPFSATGIGTQTVTDDFNRANQAPLAGNWASVGVGSFNLTGNQVVDSGSNNDVIARYTPWASGNDQYSQAAITVVGTAATSGAGVSVRADSAGANTGYRLVIDASGNFELGRMNAGVFTSLRTGTLSYVATTKLGLSITGSTLKIWYGGVQVGTNIVDGSPLASGKPGISYSSTITSYIIDNWDAGTVP